MNTHELNKRLADVAELHVTEHVRGDRLVWLIGGKQEWNPVEKIEQLWPLFVRFFPYGREFVDEPESLQHAIALAIIAANAPSREGA